MDDICRSSEVGWCGKHRSDYLDDDEEQLMYYEINEHLDGYPDEDDDDG